MHLNNYLQKIFHNSDLEKSVLETSNALYSKILEQFNYRNHVTGLLLGEVQSGKTGQMFGLISKMADEDFEIFLLLTTDNVILAEQTFRRALKDLSDFDVCNELDGVRFQEISLKKPVLVILKKNTNTLRKWKNTISTSEFCKDRPLVILDDEADAASLNTMVNKDKISQINKHLRDIKNIAPSSIYIQVTATPQSVVLQSNLSNWKPEFVHYFTPGKNYIGGDFIYSDPISFCVKFTDEDELSEVKNNSDYLPIGLQEALINYLVVCAEFEIKGRNTCNFLVHPSVRKADHQTFAQALGENLNSFFNALVDDETRNDILVQIHEKWKELQQTYPDISAYEDVKDSVEQILENEKIKIIIINSISPKDTSYDKGFNIIVGGNSLGRGVTFPNLQVAYYCRKSKVPQADTFWQHSRSFGYDRERGLMRTFFPPSLHELFTNLNNSNKILIEQIKSTELEGLQLIYPDGVSPTRKNVLDNKAVNIIAGGVNFFARNPSESDPEKIDKLLATYDDKKQYYEIDGKLFINILEIVEISNSDWVGEKYANCAKALLKKRPSQKFIIAVRRDRDIGKGTGTLLTPNDRRLSDSLKDEAVLILYRVNGKKEGWKGTPFWIPNIKFPCGLNFYDTIDL